MGEIIVFITDAKIVDEDIIKVIQYTGYAGTEKNIMLVPLLKGEELIKMESGAEVKYIVCTLINHPLFNRVAAVVLDYKMKQDMEDIGNIINNYLSEVSPEGILEKQAGILGISMPR